MVSRSAFHLILVAVSPHRSCMRKDEMMCSKVRLRRGVASGSTLGTPSRCVQAIVVAQSSDAPRFVEGKPVLHPVSKRLEAELGVVCKRLPSIMGTVCSWVRLTDTWLNLKFNFSMSSLEFLHNLWAKPAQVLFMECQWEVIMVEICIWRDT